MKLFSLITCLLISSTLIAQEISSTPTIPDDRRAKSIYLEALGNGLTISLNYDTRFAKGRNDGLEARIGVGGLGLSGTDDQGNNVTVGLVTIPIMLNYIVGNRRSGLELGAGATILSVSSSADVDGQVDDFVENGVGASGFFNVGYRAQPLRNGPIFRLTWTPAFNAAGFSPSWFGISLGYAFK
uniref:Outer membrane protein beta-barrel domain-containing protein n=1 Tax=Roseihalotalea indica TaxID=2867963 RepID=A0AA49JER8_9BACT|nr:hypothetical protein K4G66_06950 [Tunicatimonas sp. TK19036]